MKADKHYVRINFVLQANESGVGEVLLNTASVGNPLYPGSIGSVEDSNQVETEIAPFIINKEVDKESANVGEILTYTITAENLLETQVFDSGIFDTISNIEYVSFVEGSLEIIGGKGITIDVGTDSVTVDFEEIAAKEEISITFQVVVEEPAKGKTICNEASVELDTFFGKQIYSGIACTGITDLAIEKSVDKTLVDVNEELTYEIKITNNGDGTASDFYFSDTMEFLRDGYATFVNGSIVSSDSSVLTFDSVDTVSGVLNDIAPGEEVIIKFVVKPTEAGAEKELFNSATVGHPDYELTEVSSNQVVTRVNKLLVDASMINYFMYLLLLLLLLIIVRKMYVKYYIYR